MADVAAPSPPSARGEALHPLTSIRFIAAFMVLLVHFGLPILSKDPSPFRNFVSHGGFGVSLFFVLSGFILSYVYVRDKADPKIDLKQFWGARFARVYPVFFLAIVIDAIPSWMHAQKLGQHFSPGYLSGFLLTKLTMTTSWYPTFIYEPSWVDQGWTLSVEAFFYLIFPFTVLWILRWNEKLLLGTGIAFALVSWLLKLAVTAMYPHAGFLQVNGLVASDWYIHVPLLRMPEFFMGMCFGRFFSLRLARGAILGSPWLAIAGGIFAIGALALIPEAEPFHSPWFMVVDLSFGFLILGLAEARGGFEKFMSLPFFVLLGEASYAMYILQGVIYAPLKKLAEKFGQGERVDSWPFFAVAVIAIAGGSILVFKYFETPVRVKIRKLLGNKRRLVLG